MKVDENGSRLSCLELGTKNDQFRLNSILGYFQNLAQKFLDSNLV